MALKTKIGFISQDKSGREINIKDATGFEIYGKVNGYGSSNGNINDILSYYILLSRIDNTTDNIVKLKIDNTNSTIPTITQFANGQTLTITSALLQDNGGSELLSSNIFSDGVINIDMYNEFQGLEDVVITQGSNNITGGSFTNTLKGDAVLVNDKIYQIDKSKYTNGDSVLYIIGYFTEDATSFSILYRSNIKILLTSVTDQMHQYATKNTIKCSDDSSSKYISYGLCLKEAAKGFFSDDVPDYVIANQMLIARYSILSNYI